MSGVCVGTTLSSADLSIAFSSGNSTQHDFSMISFGGLRLRVTSVARVWPFGLVL